MAYGAALVCGGKARAEALRACAWGGRVGIVAAKEGEEGVGF